MTKLMIDPGHGGDDNGAAWGEKYDYVEEDDLNLDISFFLQYELHIMGYSVDLTRKRDIAVSLADRVKMANKAVSDAYISIHCDAFHNTTAKGMSVHVHPSGSAHAHNLARRIINEMSAAFPDHTNRGIKESDFYVIRKTFMPAILVECEFVSNPDTRRFLKEPENKRGLAVAIAKGIWKHFNSLKNHE